MRGHSSPCHKAHCLLVPALPWGWSPAKQGGWWTLSQPPQSPFCLSVPFSFGESSALPGLLKHFLQQGKERRSPDHPLQSCARLQQHA